MVNHFPGSLHFNNTGSLPEAENLEARLFEIPLKLTFSLKKEKIEKKNKQSVERIFLCQIINSVPGVNWTGYVLFYASCNFVR